MGIAPRWCEARTRSSTQAWTCVTGRLDRASRRQL